MTDDDRLIFVIAYAMVFKGDLPIRPKVGRKPGIAEHKAAAKAVVEHLREVGYVITKPPTEFTGPGFHGRAMEAAGRE